MSEVKRRKMIIRRRKNSSPEQTPIDMSAPRAPWGKKSLSTQIEGLLDRRFDRTKGELGNDV